MLPTHHTYVVRSFHPLLVGVLTLGLSNGLEEWWSFEFCLRIFFCDAFSWELNLLEGYGNSPEILSCSQWGSLHGITFSLTSDIRIQSPSYNRSKLPHRQKRSPRYLYPHLDAIINVRWKWGKGNSRHLLMVVAGITGHAVTSTFSFFRSCAILGTKELSSVGGIYTTPIIFLLPG